MSNKLICKRICGPGEYPKEARPVPYGSVRIKGDNANNTSSYDALPYALIESRVFLRVMKYLIIFFISKK